MLSGPRSLAWTKWEFVPQADITPAEWIKCGTLQPGFGAPTILRLPAGQNPPAGIARHYRVLGTEIYPQPVTQSWAAWFWSAPRPARRSEIAAGKIAAAFRTLRTRMARPFKDAILFAIRRAGYDLVKRH